MEWEWQENPRTRKSGSLGLGPGRCALWISPPDLIPSDAESGGGVSSL